MKIKEISPTEAWQLLQSDSMAKLLDVRSSMEYEYVGHPVNAISVPLKEPPEWETDPEFTDKVRQKLRSLCPDAERIEDIPVLAICRSGQRSHDAGLALMQQGFKQVYNVVEGFEGDRDELGHRNGKNGWRFHNLPWVQS